MKFSNLLLALPAIVLASIPPPDTSAPPPTTWPGCQYSLSCTFDAIENLTLTTRLTYLQDMEANFFDAILHCGTQ
jgi:hypothetical protein